MRRQLHFQGIRSSMAGINIRRSMLVVAVCGVLIADVLTGGGLQRRVHLLKKYGQVAMIAVIGLGLLLLVNRPGTDKMGMVSTATNVISAMPSSATTQFIQGGLGYFGGSTMQEGGWGGSIGLAQGLGGGGGGSGGGGGANGGVGGVIRRSVSEVRKKAVAAAQGWRCAHCSDMLEATYEVDHVVELQDGGNNEMDNLTALCRNCHGRKTLNLRLERQ